LGHSQSDPPPGYIPQKGFPYFVKDAKERIIGADIAGAFSALAADTTTQWLVQPPDTIQSFNITRAASDTFSSLTNEVRSYWGLDEAAGNAIDSIGTSDLPLFGSVTQSEVGVVNNCYSFTTNGSIGNIDSYYEFNESFTFGCFFKSNESSYPSGWAMVMSNFGETNYGYELLALDNGSLYWRLRYSGGNVVVTSAAGFNDNAFHSVLCSYNHVDDTMKIWIDGDLEDSDINTNGTWYSSDARMYIGSKLGYIAYFEGLVDEPTFWNRELSHAEVLAWDNGGAGDQYPYTESGGGDSLRMQNIGFDERADCVIVNYAFDTYPTTILAGTRLFAFEIDDSLDYNDTTFYWNDLSDTTAFATAWTKLGVTVTDIPKKKENNMTNKFLINVLHI